MNSNQIPEITVALVDDQTPINRYTASYLNDSTQGIRVLFTANNGQEMIRHIQTYGAPNVVVMDIRMPRMNGFEATRWLASHFPHTRVMVYTFSREKKAVLAMLRCGARGFIAKSSDTDDLAAAIRELAATGRYLNNWVTQAELRNAERGKLAPGIADIPARRLEVLLLLCQGHSQKRIAALHDTSVYTVRDHVKQLRDTFDVVENTALIDRAHECGLVPVQKDQEPSK